MPIDRTVIQPYSSLEFLARQIVEGFITGLHKSPFHGFSVEFAEHRLYNSGESTRNIDWKLYARTEKLFVKRFEEETNLRCHLIVDNSSSMYYPYTEKIDLQHPSKIVFSVYAAAALMIMLSNQRDATQLSLFSDKVEFTSQARSSRTHQHFLFMQLEKLLAQNRPDGAHTTSASSALHQLAEKSHRRSLAIIFSDMFETNENTEEMFSALQHMRHNKHEVILFHVTDFSREIDFDFKNVPTRFIDVETDQELKLTPYEVREAYRKQQHEFINELKIRCGQYQIDFMEADINAGFNHVLTEFLIKRRQMM
ncbi:MAG: DUF58 domain-containing protein [Bacteroidales bacterium]|jgi:uncharacterized protein (DUF58 family)|nr:DUF58 domain-containing protein [Bacteroidales bacterium]